MNVKVLSLILATVLASTTTKRTVTELKNRTVEKTAIITKEDNGDVTKEVVKTIKYNDPTKATKTITNRTTTKVEIATPIVVEAEAQVQETPLIEVKSQKTKLRTEEDIKLILQELQKQLENELALSVEEYLAFVTKKYASKEKWATERKNKKIQKLVKRHEELDQEKIEKILKKKENNLNKRLATKAKKVEYDQMFGERVKLASEEDIERIIVRLVNIMTAENVDQAKIDKAAEKKRKSLEIQLAKKAAKKSEKEESAANNVTEATETKCESADEESEEISIEVKTKDDIEKAIAAFRAELEHEITLNAEQYKEYIIKKFADSNKNLSDKKLQRLAKRHDKLDQKKIDQLLKNKLRSLERKLEKKNSSA